MPAPTPRRDPGAVLSRLGPAAELRQLLDAGCSRRQIAAAVRDERLLRIRRAWYARLDAPLDVRTAVALGGRLGSFSAARSYGLWTGLDDAIHVSWPPHGNVALPGRRMAFPSPVPLEIDGHRVVPHWRLLRETLAPPSPDAPWRESMEQTLAQILMTADRPTAVATADSALHRGLIDVTGMRFVLARLPGRARALGPFLDARSDSGLESIVRCWLQANGVPFLVHPVIDGIGEVDFIVGDSLIVETDGAENHATREAFFEDRRRDNVAALAGFETARLSSWQILHEWTACEARLRAHLLRGDHRRRVNATVIPG